jgi:hypothetical protein
MLGAARTCAVHGIAVPLARLVVAAGCASIPMAAALLLVNRGPVATATVGAVTYGATLLLAWRLSPSLRRLTGGAEVGYP